jgi:hypothetical protein
MGKEQRFDVHQHITDQIVTAIEHGAGEFCLPWHCAGGASCARSMSRRGRPIAASMSWRFGRRQRRRPSRQERGAPTSKLRRLFTTIRARATAIDSYSCLRLEARPLRRLPPWPR